MKNPDSAPLVSIVIATYNRSQLLYFAIQSVRQSSYTNWELIIVGDHCTDDTEKVVRSFEDDRITFVNLPVNSGQQATPNNEAAKLIKGDYVAYLNQDDLYLPNHLTNCLNTIEQEGCDMICCPYVNIMPSTEEELDRGEFSCRIEGYHANNTYQPNVFQVASSWFFKRSVLQIVGPWKLEKKLFVTPSQEWLFRAYRKNIKIHFVDRIEVITIFSGERAGSYLEENPYEHRYIFQRLNDGKFISRIIEKAGLYAYGEVFRNKYSSALVNLKMAIFVPLIRLLIRLNIHPQALPRLVRFGRKGQFIKHHKRLVGLDRT